MLNILIVGAGRVGRTIAHMLSVEPEYRVRLADADPNIAEAAVADVPGAQAFPDSVREVEGLRRALEGMSAVVSAAPFSVNPTIAQCAADAGVHYLDLTEDVQVTRFVKELAEGAKTAFIPQCGVAPGFITLAGMHIFEQFEEAHTLTLRVGALPDQPNNRLKYNLTWSTEGLVNEYIHACEALRDGKLTAVAPLEAKEEVIIDGVAYEAFTTSGGVGTLCHTLEGRVQRLDYKTIRYPGHLELARFLLEDLRFRDHPDELVRIFQRSIPTTRDDFVIVSVRGTGTSGGQLEERTFWRKVEGQHIGASFFTGIEIATSAGVCGVLHLLLTGQLPEQGLIKIEDVTFREFMESPFGVYYGRREHQTAR